MAEVKSLEAVSAFDHGLLKRSTPTKTSRISMNVQPTSTALFRVPLSLPTPEGRQTSQLRTMPDRDIRRECCTELDGCTWQ
jgi:hypothetical protein